MGTHRIENDKFIYKIKGTLQHCDFNVKYNEDGIFEGLWYESFTDIWCPFKTCYGIGISGPLPLWPLCFSAFRDLEGEAHLDITSPALTDFHLHYKEDKTSVSASAASPAIGTVGLDASTDGQSVKLNVYFHPQVGPSMSITCSRGSRAPETTHFILDSLWELAQNRWKASGEPAKRLHWETTVLKTLQSILAQLNY